MRYYVAIAVNSFFCVVISTVFKFKNAAASKNKITDYSHFNSV